MEAFERLRAATEAAIREQDLPLFLAARITIILESPERFREREAEVSALAEMVGSYDTYGQTGYLGMGVNHVILERALVRLLEP